MRSKQAFFTHSPHWWAFVHNRGDSPLRSRYSFLKYISIDSDRGRVASTQFVLGDGTSRNDGSLYECSGTPGTISLHWNIPVIIHYTICKGWCKMTGMYQSRDIVFLGRLIWGTRGPRKIVRGRIVSGRPITPLFWDYASYSMCTYST